jgi:hypothetical protein
VRCVPASKPVKKKKNKRSVGECHKKHKRSTCIVGLLYSVVDPKLFFSDPDSDPIFVRVLDPDSHPLLLVKSYGSSFRSDPKYSFFHTANDKKGIFMVF